jgi:hypothetical protein
MISVRRARDGVLAGLAGTTLMTLTTWAEKRARRGGPRIVDYDASVHVVIATATVLHLHPTTHRQRVALFALTHWGYGSAVAVEHELLRTRLSAPAAAATFYVVCQSMAFALFPTIGGTPPPWRWRRDLMASSLAQHAVYTVTVAATSSWLRRRRVSD